MAGGEGTNEEVRRLYREEPHNEMLKIYREETHKETLEAGDPWGSIGESQRHAGGWRTAAMTARKTAATAGTWRSSRSAVITQKEQRP